MHTTNTSLGQRDCILSQFQPQVVVMGSRGVISDKWSMRVLWLCAIGSGISLYMVAVDRQMKNRDRMLAESLRAAEAEGSGEDV
ncbi:hypothetical protein JRO89_XS15G0119600 [Xanthoceras sorbifolium]|uniref:Uncharacterized protein n=1 Tax=Xanthoceras sorbifolium TaxID=99658 RepID=A0ABQ8H1S9_9ROSI|nr:hypothetical protein JRO89_XS15G0119600 [Xanthoceras sorbifolium]